MNPSTTPHYGMLRAYVHAVVSDLLRRGTIRRRYVGESLEEVVRSEGVKVLEAVEGDLLAIGAELGISALGAFRGAVEKIFGQGEQAILDFLGIGTGRKK